jgi:FlaA1/EpsC-like NDP-sugar epimerase
MQGAKIIVTGGAGSIGSAVVDVTAVTTLQDRSYANRILFSVAVTNWAANLSE